MTQDPRLRTDTAISSYGRTTEQAGTSHATDECRSPIGDISRELAAHGAGAAAVDLAFDLVLHDLVKQARERTRATGAAIALIRDGEMVCRATTGENAPELGIRVDLRSGLAVACMNSGEIQNCRDTETDARVNSDACRRLGVRSILIAPIHDSATVIGILQILSSQSGAFGTREVDSLEPLLKRISEERIEAQREIERTLRPYAEAPVPCESSIHGRARPTGGSDSTIPAIKQVPANLKTVWVSLLFIAVLGVAVFLGWLIGWRGGSREKDSARNPAVINHIALARDASPDTATRGSSGAATDSAVIVNSPDNGEPKAADKLHRLPSAAQGLLITENGRVIYPSPKGESTTAPTSSESETPISRVVRSVEPEYPAEARARHLQGPVVMNVKILGNGSVGDAVVISGTPLLADAAVHAVKKWRFRPYLKSGKAVESEIQITIRFILPGE